MELEIIKGLAQYGVLGLWTASLLFMNWQQRKDKKEEEKEDKLAAMYKSQDRPLDIDSYSLIPSRY